MGYSSNQVDKMFLSYQGSGAPEDLAPVFDATAAKLMQLANHLTPDLHEASDLLQATFLVAIQRRADYKATGRVSSWLSGIMVNEVRARRRASSYRKGVGSIDGLDGVDAADGITDLRQETPLQALEGKELSKAVTDAIARMPEQYQPVLLLSLRQGWSADNIALNLSRSPATVRTQLSRGLEKLRMALPAGLIAGTVVLTTPVYGIAATREAVLTKATAVAAKAASTSAALTKLTLWTAAGTLTAAALAVSLMAPDKEQLTFDELSPEATAQVVAQKGFVDSSATATSALQADPFFPSSRVLMAFPSLVTDAQRSAITMTENMNSHSSLAQNLGIPSILLGAMTLLPVLGQSQSVIYYHAGENAGDYMGRSVSGAGDVNADGYDDIVSGAYGWDLDAVTTFSGRAYVYSGKDGATLWTFEGEAKSDLLGYSVSGAGDVNADGYADIVTGAYLYDPDPDGTPGNGDELSAAGRVYLYSGKDGSLIRTHNGENAGDNLGWELSDAGDVNADGYADIVVGAHNWDADLFGPDGTASTGDEVKSNGRIYVFSGFDGSTLWTFDGENVSDNVGHAVSSAGDLNSDGHDDFMTGATGWDFDAGAGVTSNGRVYVISGKSGSPLFTVEGESKGDGMGYNLSAAGDMNADGALDIVAGAYKWDEDLLGPDGTASTGDEVKDNGQVYVISGTPLSLTADKHELSLGVANSQTMTIHAGVANAGMNYWLFTGFAASGDTPGVTMAPGVVIPLNQPDPLTSFFIGLTQLGGGAPTFAGWKSSLDGAGKATPSLNTFGPTPAPLGVTLHHAALVYTSNGCGVGCDTFQLATNWVPMTTTP